MASWRHFYEWHSFIFLCSSISCRGRKESPSDVHPSGIFMKVFVAVVCAVQPGGGAAGSSLSESSPRGPHFDTAASKNVTALLGKTAYLNCRVKNLANRTVSFSILWVLIVRWWLRNPVGSRVDFDGCERLRRSKPPDWISKATGKSWKFAIPPATV